MLICDRNIFVTCVLNILCIECLVFFGIGICEIWSHNGMSVPSRTSFQKIMFVVNSDEFNYKIFMNIYLSNCMQLHRLIIFQPYLYFQLKL